MMDQLLARDMLERLGRIEQYQVDNGRALAQMQAEVVGVKADVAELRDELAPIKEHVSEVQFWTRFLSKSRVIVAAVVGSMWVIWERYGDKVIALFGGPSV